MVRATLNQTSFTGGEISPRAIGRTDIDRYGTALKRARNCHPVITGGVKQREGSLYAAVANAGPGESVLIPFVKSRSEAWMLEFCDQKIRIFNSDGQFLTELTTVYTVADLPTLDWAQSDATMYLFNPSFEVYRLQRIGSSWVLSPAPFTTVPFDETGIVPAVSLTLSASSVGVGRTATASGAVFLASDVGRGIISDVGIAVITAYTSTTVVTVEITRAFSGTGIGSFNWTLESSPKTSVTPSAKDPEGATITLTAGAAAWRSSDVGAHVRLNGGLVKISAFTSTTVVDAVIERELTSTVAAPADAWSIEYPVWSAINGYPRTGTIHQQRLICAGTTKYPMTVWGSRIGELLDFGRWTNDDDSFAFTIQSDETTPITYVTSARDLVVLTESGEYSMRSGVEKPLTPTNVRVVPEKNHGTAQVRPVLIGDETMFVQRAGRKVRSLGWRYEFDSYKAPDLTALSDHITKSGITSMVFQQEPDLLLWAVRGDGKFLTCVIDRDQQPSVIGWALHETIGTVECVASIPKGDRDQVWAIVTRVINGVTRVFIERFDGTFEALHPSTTTDGPVYGCTVDCGVVIDNAAGQSSFTVSHLPSTTVAVVADGSDMGEITTDSLGQFTLPRTSKRTLIGLPFASEAALLTPELGTGEGSSQGNAARSGEITMRFLETIGAKVVDAEGSEQTIPFRTFGTDVLDNAPEPFTGLMRVSKLGWQRGVSELSVVQRQPLPWHLLGVIRKHTVNS